MSTREKGSVLPIMAAIVTGIGLVVAGISVFSEEERATRLETSARPKLDRIADSLVTHYKAADVLPCPADGRAGDGKPVVDGSGDCDSALGDENKVVPYEALGLADALDPWGQQISYKPLADLVPGATLPHDLNGNGLTVCTGPTSACSKDTDKAAFVIFSHGRPRAGDDSGTTRGNGAFDAGGERDAMPSQAQEVLNITTPPAGTSAQFFALPRSTPDVMQRDPSNAFEQILVYKTLDDLKKNGPGGAEEDYAIDINRPQDKDKIETTVPPNGSVKIEPARLGKRPGDDKNWIGFGNPNGKEDEDGPVGHLTKRVSCAWVEKVVPWSTDGTLRLSFRFQFAPGEDDKDNGSGGGKKNDNGGGKEPAEEDQGYGDGFTMTLVPGPRKLTDDEGLYICGLVDHMAYAGGSIGTTGSYDPTFKWDTFFPDRPTNTAMLLDHPHAMPKMALEIDTYNHGSAKGEGAIARNHAALLLTTSTDSVAHGTGDNPACPDDFGDYANASDSNGETSAARGCTYSDSVVSWTEYPRVDESTLWYVNKKVAPEYTVRMEIERACGPTCGEDSCGLPPAEGQDARDYTDRSNMWVRTWIERTDTLRAGGVEREKAFTEDLFRDLSDIISDSSVPFGASDAPDNYINWCGPDPSLQVDSYLTQYVTFDTFKLGFTAAASSNKGMAVSLTDVRAVVRADTTPAPKKD